jgi:hypothetical protein
MNRFTVVWVKDVLDELAEIWMSSNEREAVTLATQEIDHSLSTDPGSKGGELKEGIRFFLAHHFEFSIRSMIQIDWLRLSWFDQSNFWALTPLRKPRSP